MLFQVGELRRLGSDAPRLRFGQDEKPEGAWAGRRLMFLDDRPAYELSFPCGTCQFLFRRLAGSNDTLTVEELRERLAGGTKELDDDVITSFGQLLERGTYLPMLLSIRPRLVAPSLAGDYFAEEQLRTWGVDSFWGLPAYPSTAYYRTFETPVSRDAHLYEFLVPMLPPAWADPERVAAYVERLSGASVPTAVAVATLDVCAPAVAPAGSDWYEHWGLTHFLLDGHHKVQAAAEAQRTVRVLSLLAVESSLAAPEQVARVPTLRRQRPDGRRPTAVGR